MFEDNEWRLAGWTNDEFWFLFVGWRGISMHFSLRCSTNKQVGRDQVECQRQGVPGAA